jgi:transmembrane sensor
MIHSETDILLAKYFAGELSADEKLKVEAWKNLSSGNLDLFNKNEQIWKQALKDKNAISPDIEQALKKVNQTIKVPNLPPQKSINITGYLLRIAAVFILGCGIWMTYHLIKNHRESSMILVKADKIQKYTLPDGTLVWLNAHSQLQYPHKFVNTTRTVILQGEAYFEVEKDPSKPFIIDAGKTWVRVLGTKFNVKSSNLDHLTTVTVSEGKVSFTPKKILQSKGVYLLAGDKGIFDSQTSALKQEKNTDLNTLAWKTGSLIFKNTPLSKALSDISDCYQIQLVLNNNSKNELPFTATFDNQKLSDIISILEATFDIKATKNNNKIIFK